MREALEGASTGREDATSCSFLRLFSACSVIQGLGDPVAGGPWAPGHVFRFSSFGRDVDQVCRPRRAGAVPAQPRGARKDFAALFDEWLKVRFPYSRLSLRVDDSCAGTRCVVLRGSWSKRGTRRRSTTEFLGMRDRDFLLQGWKVYQYTKVRSVLKTLSKGLQDPSTPCARLFQDPVVKSQPTWETAFHGTWWYSARAPANSC